MPENSVKIILEAADKTKEAFESIKSSSEGLVSTLKEHWVAFSAAAIGSIYAVKKVFDFGKEIGSNLNDIQKQAEMIGLTTTEYQKLSYAAKMNDVSNESLRMGMKGLSLSMGQFVDETGDGYEVLKALGLSAVDATGKQKPLNQMLMEIADKFSSYADGAAKVDYANRLMGRSGMDLIMMLNKGREGIAGYGEELVKMGGLIDENIVRKGSAAEDAFKNIDVQIKSMKSNLAPAAAAMADLGESITRYLTPGFEKLGERMSSIFGEKGKGMFFKSVDELLDYSKKMAEKPPMPKLVTPPEQDWVKKWVEQWDALKYSFEQLGIESQQSLAKAAEAANVYKDQIKKAFSEGKATVTDYKNALIAATETIKKVTGEDQTKKLVDLYAESQKEIDAISKDDPDRAKKVQGIIDRWSDARKAITQTLAEAEGNYKDMMTRLNQIKIEPGIDISKVQESIKKLEEELNEMRRQAQVPIKIQVESPPSVNIDVTGSGSPTMPISDKIKEIIAQFGGLGNAISTIEANINFKEIGQQIEEVRRAMEKMDATTRGYMNLSRMNAWNYGQIDPDLREQLLTRMADLQSKMDILKMQQMVEELTIYKGSFQTGGRVGATGLYVLHKGEEVRTTNQVSDNRVNKIYISGAGDPREVAKQVMKALKYNMSGELIEAIRKLK